MPDDLVPGTLDLVSLKAVSLCLQHGCGALLLIQQGGALRIEQGAIYYVFETQAPWGASEGNRRARFSAVTAQGHKRLGKKTDTWNLLLPLWAQAVTAKAEEL